MNLTLLSSNFLKNSSHETSSRFSSGQAFGEAEMKEFMYMTERLAAKLEENMSARDADYRVALLHYSPIKDTLAGERLEIYPFLGSYLLAEAIDLAGADLVIHGHAHKGTEKGSTARGISVRNVAMPLIKRPYAIYTLGLDRRVPVLHSTSEQSTPLSP